MPERTQASNPGPFIASELRPSGDPDLERFPPLGPETSREELQRSAGEVLGEAGRQQLGLSDGDGDSRIWHTVFSRSPDVNSTVLDREAVLLNLENGVYYSLNPVGTAIWESLNGDRSLEEVLSALRERFDVPNDVARDDLEALVARLRQEGLIEERR